MTGCAPQASMPGRVSRFDLAALADRFAPLLPAGFYYKTFMGASGRLWRTLWEPLLRHMAGLGRAPAAAGPVALRQAPRALRRAGGRRRAGRAERGAGGRSARRAGDPRRQRHRVRRRAAAPRRRGSARPTARPGRATRSPNSTRCRKCGCCRETTVLGYYDDNYLIAAERVGERLGPAAPAGLPRQRLWHIRARRVVLATGAIERPPVFPDNDRPGIMLAGAVETYLHRYAVTAGTARGAVRQQRRRLSAGRVAGARPGSRSPAIVDPRPEPGEAARRLADGHPALFRACGGRDRGPQRRCAGSGCGRARRQRRGAGGP